MKMKLLLLLLDASKAFDNVEYHKLVKSNVCPFVLRLLINMYINQKFQVNGMLCYPNSIVFLLV